MKRILENYPSWDLKQYTKQKITTSFWDTVHLKMFDTFSFFGWAVILSCQQNVYRLLWSSNPTTGTEDACAARFLFWGSTLIFPSSVWTQCPIILFSTSHLFHFSVRYISSFHFKVSLTRMSPHLVSEAAYGDDPERSHLCGDRHKLSPSVSVLTTLGLGWPKSLQTLWLVTCNYRRWLSQLAKQLLIPA